MGVYDYSGVPLNLGARVYNCNDFGVTVTNEDNTDALQALIDFVYSNGGGIIWFPIGTYVFNTSLHYGTFMVKAKSNVSFIGESINGTVLKLIGNTQRGKLFIVNDGSTDEPITGCTYANFTVDASATTSDTYSYLGKGFMYEYVKNCVWRDIVFIGFVATALGIDLLDNVVIDSIYCYNCGKGWTYGGTGGAGIGIGTGTSGWDHENFIIRNCICDSCGHFGIFLEDQGMFRNPKTQNHPKGQIIANNIVHDGLYYGIGVRGGRYVTVENNNIYSNASGGIYLDYGVDRSFITGNLISNEVNAISFGNEASEAACTRIVITNNTFAGCTNGIVQTLTPTDCVIQNNITIA